MRFILAVLLVSLTFTDAHPQQVPPREIELKLLPVDVTDGVPTGFTFVLTNVSNEDLRVPPPTLTVAIRLRKEPFGCKNHGYQ